MAIFTCDWAAAACAGRSGHEEQGADPLVVEGEALRIRGRDQELEPGPEEPVHPVGVLAQPVAESLVGEVDERQEPPVLDEVADPRARDRATGRRRSGCGTSRGAGRRRPGDASPSAASRAASSIRRPGRIRVRVLADPEASRRKSCGWFGQVGWLIQIVPLPPVWRRKSAATRSPPVPPGVWLTADAPGSHDLVLGREDEVADRVAEGGLAVDGPVELGPARRRGSAAPPRSRTAGPASSRSRPRRRPTTG